jgi:hypothetical protein
MGRRPTTANFNVEEERGDGMENVNKEALRKLDSHFVVGK